MTRRGEAQRLADAWLQALWAGREEAEFAVSPRRIALEPGDLVRLPTTAGPQLHRVLRIADGPTRRASTRAVEPSVYDIPGRGSGRGVREPPAVAGRPEVVVLDLPAANGEPAALQHLAVAADPWPGTVAVWRSADDASYSLHRTVDLPAVIGRTLTALQPGPLWRWDSRNMLDVELSSGAVASVTDAAALAGANVFALRGSDGEWEILSVARAELIGPRRYRLSRLVRGLGAGEAAARRAAPAGSTLVRLDEALVPLVNAVSDLGTPWRYRIGAAERDHADAAVVQVTAVAGPAALKPFAPVHVSARRIAEGIWIRWIRRTRFGGDAWEATEVPLNEATEAYEVDVLQGGAVVRTLAASAPGVLYPAASELADFGGPQAALALRVVQTSAAVGRGFEAVVTTPVA